MRKRITVLGAGPAGLWTALTLQKRIDAEIILVEKGSDPGGITGSFTYNGLTFDYGSHRLHPATDPATLEEIGGILNGDLLKRPRNGRIWLEGRFIGFPLKPVDLLLHLPPSFSLGFLSDSLFSLLRSSRTGATFEDTLLAGLGSTISRRFYFPYARKLWGLSPGRLSPVQARKRIASGSIGKMIRKTLASLVNPGGDSGIFYYPAGGFGQIAQRAAALLERNGARILYHSPVVSMIPPARGRRGKVRTAEGDEMETDFIFSTIPVTDLLAALGPAVPSGVREAAKGLSYRSMVFLYLELDCGRYTPFDAHYFPGEDTCFSRLSEPKNYSCAGEPSDRTGLCFEIPCSKSDAVWAMDSEHVLGLVMDQLEKTGLPLPRVLSHTVRRMENIYPVYDLEFAPRAAKVQDHLSRTGGVVSLGRQGLFVHDNTHHTMEMGIAAAGCLDQDLKWDQERWEACLRRFEEHVVVD